MEDIAAIARYEKYMMKKIPRYYLTGTDDEKEQSALSVLRYIITELLCWTPQEASLGLNKYIVDKMHIDVLLAYIHQPIDVVPDEDYDYLLYMAFPGEMKYNPEAKIIEKYVAVVNGQKDKYPKNFFNRIMGGRMRARCVLSYAVEHNIIIQGNPEVVLYKLFADSEQIWDLLRKWKLDKVCRTLYDSDPLRYLKDTLADSEIGDFLFYNYTFQQQLSDILQKHADTED